MTDRIAIYFFCKECSRDWIHQATAISSDGQLVAEHTCTSHSYLHTDLIVRHKTDHDKRFGEVAVDDPATHEGLQAAYKLNQARREMNT